MSIHDSMLDACRAVGIEPPRKVEQGRWCASPVVGKGRGNTSGRVMINDDGRTGVANRACDVCDEVAQKANTPRVSGPQRVLTSPACKEVEMASSRVCAIVGCRKTVAARGWCSTHYKRWAKYGDPLIAKKAGNGDLIAWVHEVALAYDGDECLSWPFGRTRGYGSLSANGRKDYAHRIICEIRHGPQPEGDYHASHSCGNGHLGCVNPRHICWKTRVDNFADRLTHGTDHRGEKHPRAKLSAPEVKQIKQLLQSKGVREIARMFDVSPGAISSIRRGKNWVWLE